MKEGKGGRGKKAYDCEDPPSCLSGRESRTAHTEPLNREAGGGEGAKKPLKTRRREGVKDALYTAR